MTTDRKEALITLKKAQGLLQKISTMLANDDYCIDIMQQNLAAIGLLKSAHQSLLEGHLHTCVASAIASASPAKKQSLIEEIIRVTKIAGK